MGLSWFVWVLILLWNIEVESGVAGLTKFFRRSLKSSWWEPSSQYLKVSPLTSKTRGASDSHSKRGDVYETDHLCIDMNQFLHSSFRTTTDAKHFMARVFTGLDAILNTIKPLKSLVLVFDGPAPFAKMQTQKIRRAIQPENSLITPGTEFMTQMENVMMCYALQRMQRNDFKNLTFFISGSDCPGEGELKIVDWINNHMPSFNDSIVICGSDSDILLQAMALPQIPQAVVFQVGSDYSDAFCKISSLIDNLCNYAGLYDNVAVQKSDSASPNDVDTNVKLIDTIPSLRLDLVFLFLLQGNDYLPKLRGVTMASVLKSYGHVMQKLPPSERYLIDLNKNTFNFVALWLLLGEFATSAPIVQLPLQLPTSQQYLHTILQRRKKMDELIWDESGYPKAVKDPINGESKLVWASTLTVEGKAYSVEPIYTTKQQARNAVSNSALLAVDADAYKELQDKRLEIATSLMKLKNGVVEEGKNRSVAPSAHPDIDTDLNIEFLDGVDADFEGDQDTALDDALFGDIKGTVSSKEYAKYIRDSDIECYLNGLLWVLQMYSDGSCPDLSYSYFGRPPISPYVIMKYIEKAYLKSNNMMESAGSDVNDGFSITINDLRSNVTGVCGSGLTGSELRKVIAVPSTSSKPLSAAATCVCVIPKEGESYVPPQLKDAWINMQLRLQNDSLAGISYDSMTKILQDVWSSTQNKYFYVNHTIPELGNISLASYAQSKTNDKREFEHLELRRNQRRGSRMERKVKGQEKRSKKYNAFARKFMIEKEDVNGTASLDYVDDNAVHNETVPATSTGDFVKLPKLGHMLVRDGESDWKIISGRSRYELSNLGYKEKSFRTYPIKLPLPLAFSTPKKLPQGVRVYLAVEYGSNGGSKTLKKWSSYHNETRLDYAAYSKMHHLNVRSKVEVVENPVVNKRKQKSVLKKQKSGSGIRASPASPRPSDSDSNGVV